jgi:hypothetical protein
MYWFDKFYFFSLDLVFQSEIYLQIKFSVLFQTIGYHIFFNFYIVDDFNMTCGSLPWEPPTGYQIATVVTNSRNNTGIVTSGFYIWFASRHQQKYTWKTL